MGGGPKDGLKSALDQAVEAFEPDAPAEQVALFPVEALAGLPSGRFDRQAAMQGPRPKGRPPGSVNRATLANRDYILARRRSPLMVLADAISRSVHDLAAELGCSKLEAFDRQISAATALAPYLHGKMPVEVQVSGQGLPVLMLADPAAMAAALAGAASGDLPDLSSLRPIGGHAEQNQGVIEGQARDLDAQGLDAVAKPLNSQGDAP